MVTQSKAPKARCSSARGMPDTISQMTLSTKDPAPPPYTTSFPKGKKLSPANLKHCNPIGIPTMVTHQRHPARSQLTPLTAPPKINQQAFPRQPIKHSSCLLSTSGKKAGVFFIGKRQYTTPDSMRESAEFPDFYDKRVFHTNGERPSGGLYGISF